MSYRVLLRTYSVGLRTKVQLALYREVKSNLKAKLKIIFSMTIFGTLAIFVNNIPLSTGEIALFRALIASLVIVIYKFITKNKIPLREIKKDLPLLFVSGAAMGFNWILLFQAYHYTTVSIATLSYYFAPVIVMASAPLFFKEKLTAKQIICFIMSTIGLIMIINTGGVEKSSGNLVGISYGLGAAILYATVIILNKLIVNVTGVDRTLVQFIASIIVLTPYLLVTSSIHIENIGTLGMINLLVLGIVHTGIAYCVYFSSLKDLKGQEAAILSYIDPFVAILVSVSILGESINPVQILGGTLILGFTLLNEFSGKWKDESGRKPNSSLDEEI